jgi:hypothetical protein
MTTTQQELLRKAKTSLDAAILLLNNNYPDYATSRAYYTMFYVAEASNRSHALRGNAFGDALRPVNSRRRASRDAFLRRAQER